MVMSAGRLVTCKRLNQRTICQLRFRRIAAEQNYPKWKPLIWSTSLTMKSMYPVPGDVVSSDLRQFVFRNCDQIVRSRRPGELQLPEKWIASFLSIGLKMSLCQSVPGPFKIPTLLVQRAERP
jgi:hypothetical protein